MLASLDDLAAIGALPVDEPSTSTRAARAKRLLELVSGQVVAYLRVDDEAAVRSEYTDAQLTAVAAVVAEAAGQRLNASAAPSSDFQPVEAGWSSALLNRRHIRAIDRALGRAGRGSRTIDTGRDEETSFLTYSQAGNQETTW